MKSTTIRELKHDTTKVLSWVEQGESVEIRRRNQPIAVLSSPQAPTSLKMPDFRERMRKIYGDKVLATTFADDLAEERGER